MASMVTGASDGGRGWAVPHMNTYDNFGHENLSLPPGAGSIDWPQIIAGLKTADYRGSFDIEIACPREDVRQRYTEGRAFIESLLSN